MQISITTACCNIFTFLLLLLKAEAQLQVAPNTYWICDSTTHTYVVLNDMGVEYNGAQHLIGSVFKFTGAAYVSIEGGTEPEFNIIEVSKQGAGTLRLFRDIQIANKVRFNEGLIDLNGNVLFLNSNAFLETESQASRCIGTTGGHIELTTILTQPVNVNPGNLGAIITTAQTPGKTIIRRGHISQQNNNGGGSSILRYYDILPQQNTRLSASLQFNYLDEELNGLMESRLILVKRETANDPWEATGEDEHNTVSNYVVKKDISSFSRWTLTNTDNALPVTWHSFSVQCNNNAFIINWSTAAESNTKSFIIQRSSNSSEWQDIHTLPASGNSNTLQQYSYIDGATLAGNQYYRIMQTDVDGNFSYSKVMKASCVNTDDIIVYPNPVKDNISVSINNTFNSREAEIILYNSAGAVLQRKRIQLQQGKSLLQLPVSGLPSGMYTLKIKLDKQVKHFKIIKQ
ncbi:MAG: T9SS type A sorting domain-containing protein [Chitinophagaceae bacterium]|nr:T9SS type A sorting domain-containing protein [Chitinophagaceae bacterium]